MERIPVPVRVVAAVALVAVVLSGLYARFAEHDEALVLEPHARDEAARLRTLEEEATAPPALPAVPTLPPGTSLSRTHGEGATVSERGDDLSAEMRIVSEARTMMAEDPQAALALLDQHRERYPRGALREEREAHAILILRRLERTTEAERRYMDFLSDFPGSSFLATLSSAP